MYKQLFIYIFLDLFHQNKSKNINV